MFENNLIKQILNVGKSMRPSGFDVKPSNSLSLFSNFLPLLVILILNVLYFALSSN